MSKIDNGGSAFPKSDCIDADMDTIRYSEGMTLRDYFAAAALTGLISTGNYGLRTIACSEVAYDYADAMLEARKGGV